MALRLICAFLALSLAAALAAPVAEAVPRLCNGRPCLSRPEPVGRCGIIPKNCVCEFSPRTGTWEKACPKHGGPRPA